MRSGKMSFSIIKKKYQGCDKCVDSSLIFTTKIMGRKFYSKNIWKKEKYNNITTDDK